MNAAELVANTQLIADDGVNRRLWDPAEIALYLAEGEQEAARRARLLRDSTTAATSVYSLTAGARFVQLDPRVVFVRVAHLDSFDLPLARTRRQFMDIGFPGWDRTVDLGEVRRVIPDYQNGFLYFDAPLPADDVLRLTVIREPLNAISTGAPSYPTMVVDHAGPGTLTISCTTPGTGGNGVAINFGGATGAGHESRALSATLTFPTSIDVVLATDIAGAYDDTANTFDLVADAINALGTGLTAGLFSAVSTDPTGSVTDVDSGVLAGGSLTTVVDPEIPARYHHSLIHWALYRMFGKQDAETNDPTKAARSLKVFEDEFGPRSRAIDETYINEQYMFDDFDGTF